MLLIQKGVKALLENLAKYYMFQKASKASTVSQGKFLIKIKPL